MTNFERIKILTKKEQEKKYDDEITNYGLRGSIKKRLDDIVDMCSMLNSDFAKMQVQAYCVEILDLINAYNKRT